MIRAIVLVTLLLITLGCGGGGGGVQASPPQTGSAKFVDAPVDGLTYTSGSISGTTKNGGAFNYQVGSPVSFYVGGILLGTIPADTLTKAPQGITTPIDMAPAGSGATTPEVVARVRFLTAIAPPDSSGIMTITPAIQGITNQPPINFATVTDAVLLNAAKALSNSVAALPASTDATNHLNSSLLNNSIYTLSGSATLNGAAYPGVALTVVGGGTSYAVTTDSNGNFSVSGVTNGTYTVTPAAAAGYVFSPSFGKTTVNNGNPPVLNFTAAATYTLSGKISLGDGGGLSGVAIFIETTSLLTGPTGVNYNTVSAADGTYAISGLTSGFYRITPTLVIPNDFYNFGPQNPYSVQINNANNTAANFTAALNSSATGGVTH